MGGNTEIDGITFRIAGVGDVELLSRTRLEFFMGFGEDIPEEKKSEIYTGSLEYFGKSLKDGSFLAYLAFDGDRLAATSGVTFYTTPPRASGPGLNAYISNMYTRPEYRGRGIATRLFDMTAGEAQRRGCGKAMLYATDMGKPIYEKYGFYIPENYMEYKFER